MRALLITIALCFVLVSSAEASARTKADTGSWWRYEEPLKAKVKKAKKAKKAKPHVRRAHRTKRPHHHVRRPARLLEIASSGKVTTGKASWYSEGKRTATGARYNPDGVSCAHRDYPFGTLLEVTDLRTRRSITCPVNDRGPFIRGRIVDLSRGAARQLGMIQAGIVPVTVRVLR